MKFSIKDFFSKCDQIRSYLRIWSHLLKKSLMGNFIFCALFIACIELALPDFSNNNNFWGQNFHWRTFEEWKKMKKESKNNTLWKSDLVFTFIKRPSLQVIDERWKH